MRLLSDFDFLKMVCYCWALGSLAFFLGWVVLFIVSMRAAYQKGYRGHWWGKYVLGLHALLRNGFLFWERHSVFVAKCLAFFYQVATLPFGIELPLSTRIGKGLTISHTSGIVVHKDATIGDNCTIHSGVVLGGKGRQDPPHIGNNVYIGANATVLGPIRVGDSATIGALALVLSDVPQGALVCANPAVVVKESYSRPYANSEVHHETAI